MSKLPQSETYTDAGEKTLLLLNQGPNESSKFTIKAGASDVYTVDIQLTRSTQRIGVPAYKNKSNDNAGRISGKCHAIGLNISANTSGAITIDVNPEK